MSLNLKFEPWKTIIPYLLISAIIFIFNIISIWGFDGLLIDDQGYYYRLYNKSVIDLEFNRNIFQAFFLLGVIKITAYTSVYFARFLIIVLLSIPSAYMLYYFAYYHYQLKKHISIAIAVFPFILPNEVQVPTYLSGSYMLLAILFTLISIYFILKYSKREGYSVAYLILASAFYYMATESSEIIAVMLPVFLFLIFICRKLSVKPIILGSLITFIAIRKAILTINHPHGKINSVSNDLAAEEIKRRIINFVDFINPFHGPVNMDFMNIILFGIILSGFIIVMIKQNRLQNILHTDRPSVSPKYKYCPIIYFYLFPLALLIFSTYPFIFHSKDFTGRYFIISSVALGFLFVISLSVIFSMITKRKIHLAILMILFIIFCGFSRQVHFTYLFKTQKEQYKQLKQTLETNSFPEDVQIIVAAPGREWLSLGYGLKTKSNGTLQYVLKRRDVHGQIMKEKYFYDPFQITNDQWKYPDKNLDTNRNTFLFRCFNKDSSQNRRLHYALRWEKEKSKDSPWSIFHFDEQGKATKLTSGCGYMSYESTVDSISVLGISRKDILFGGKPDRLDSLRLGL